MSRRGYFTDDEKQFKGKQLELLKKAANEVQFLLDQGYDVKASTTFVGNHYMFSERQRLALARTVSSHEWIARRHSKELLHKDQNLPATVHIDGFNAIITLEVALSGSPIFVGRDGVLRDLAGLRGTYRLIDQTEIAINLLLRQLEILNIKEAYFYLDRPVSNSGRLAALIRDCAGKYNITVMIDIIPDVDRALEKLPAVVSGDAIILNNCVSWLNLTPRIVEQIEDAWIIQL